MTGYERSPDYGGPEWPWWSVPATICAIVMAVVIVAVLAGWI